MSDIDKIAAGVAERLAQNPAVSISVVNSKMPPFVITLTVDKFQTWLRASKKGDHAIYHTGYHLQTVPDMQVAVQRAKQAGLVAMKQLRAGTNAGFHYMAERLHDARP